MALPRPRLAGPDRHVSALPVAVFVLAAGIAAWAVYSQRHEISRALGHVVWWALPLSYVACMGGLLCVYRAWAALVADAGLALTPRQALRIYGLGQIAKYMPGGLWSVVMQAQLVREVGGSRLRMASASVVILILGVAVSLSMGSLMLPLSGSEARDHYWYAPLLAVAMVLVLVPKVLNRGSALASRLLRQEASTPTYTSHGILAASTWMAGGNLLFGLHLQAIGHGLGVTGPRGFLLSTTAYCLAASLGLLFVPAPAGAGVRELVITVVLAPTISSAGALVVALLSRVVAVAADVTLALSQLGARRCPRRKTVFVSRRFPPSVGGMETLASSVWMSIRADRPDAVLIAHGGSNRALLGWIPRAAARLMWLAATRRVEFVLVGDAPTYAVLEPLLRLCRVPRATMILGLDVTYDNAMYRKLVLGALRRAPQVVAISAATRDEAVAAGVDPGRISVLRLGVAIPPVSDAQKADARAGVHDRLGLADEAVVLLTLGRLVRRKGCLWFVEHVVPRLPEHTHFVVAGDGPDREQIERAVTDSGCRHRVHLLGGVSDEVRDELMLGSDLFVQPNVAVPGDMEGFGLVTVEAAVRATPVVAADLEGLRDAVVDDVTGYLVRSGDADRWVERLTALVADLPSLQRLGWRFRDGAASRFSESAMAAELNGILFPPETLP